ncbi:hypothetical protein D782_2558 [Enterobacteriaceae bacterium strain FGI 57]|nr:hypothetical protein D782_2558 [Enterobacteriaceae bacterium strain FGI 57]
MICRKRNAPVRERQIAGKVRFVLAGCGVNALSGLQNIANSIYCRNLVGLISAAHEAMLCLSLFSRSRQGALRITL